MPEVMFSLPIVEEILSRLEVELDPALRYHSAAHSREVVRDALMLAAAEGLPARERELLLIAAAFHDSGFLEDRNDHEARSAEMAAREMEACGGYSAEETEIVAAAIRDTRLNAGGPVQTASTPISPCLLDADLANLGKPDFDIKTGLLRLETGERDEGMFARAAIGLMRAHRWQTLSAAGLWQRQKEINLARLLARTEHTP